MANVQVSRQTLDESNQLDWVIITVDELELMEGEIPYEPPPSAA